MQPVLVDQQFIQVYPTGLDWWQIVLVALLTISAYDLLAYQFLPWLGETVYLRWRDWQDRHAEEPVNDATDTEHEPDKPFVPSVPRM